MSRFDIFCRFAYDSLIFSAKYPHKAHPSVGEKSRYDRAKEGLL